MIFCSLLHFAVVPTTLPVQTTEQVTVTKAPTQSTSEITDPPAAASVLCIPGGDSKAACCDFRKLY